MQHRIKPFLDIIRFDKPVGTLLLLWPTLGALWIASGGVPSTSLLAIFIGGTFLMRSAGCIINDLADRKIDGGVDRTHARPLVTGSLSVNQAIGFFIVLCLAAFALVLLTNSLTIMLSVAALVSACAYPFMKRYTHLPQLVLGLAFSFGIPMAFSAELGELPSALWLLFLANLLWTVAYDTEYAMVDREDDLKIGVKSTAILLGDADKLVIGVLQGMSLLAMHMAGARFELGLYYNTCLVIAAALFVYQQWLIKTRSPEGCFKAFKHNNWVGMVLFLGIASHYYFTV
jgi:4-hydroxybenzoate polyprenyltransferase